jgi:hypothetical protein
VAGRAVLGKLDRTDDPDGPACFDPDDDAAGLAWKCRTGQRLQVHHRVLSDQHRPHRLSDSTELVERSTEGSETRKVRGDAALADSALTVEQHD